MDLEDDDAARPVDVISVLVLEQLQLAGPNRWAVGEGRRRERACPELAHRVSTAAFSSDAAPPGWRRTAPDAEIGGDLDPECGLEAGLLHGAGVANVKCASGVAGFVWAGEPLGGVVEARRFVPPAAVGVVMEGVPRHRRTDTWMWS